MELMRGAITGMGGGCFALLIVVIIQLLQPPEVQMTPAGYVVVATLAFVAYVSMALLIRLELRQPPTPKR